MTLRTPSVPPPGPGADRWPGEAALTGGRAAAAVLALFWLLMVAALEGKSLTYDEVAHAAAGYSYWHYGDYRLQPENGQLPQRVAGLPMALALAPFPAPEADAWANAEQWQVGGQWIYGSGRDAEALGREGRMGCALFAVALGALVWAWSRRLFGPRGGMVSLLLFVLSPTVLANGALMTSDMAAALFFAAALGAFWTALGRPSPLRVLGSAVVMGALFLTKASALIVLPVAALLVLARLLDGRPLPLLGRTIASRGRQAAVLAAVVAVHAAVIVALLWGSYGFRYSAFAGEGRFRLPWESLLGQPAPLASLRALPLDAGQRARIGEILGRRGVAADRWTNPAVDAVADIRREVLTPAQAAQFDAAQAVRSPTLWVRVVGALREHRLLPEAWIYGLVDVLRRSEVRPAFLNGDFRLRGWPWFFPYTFAVKTPLAVFGLLALALGAVRWRTMDLRSAWAALYPSLPLWVFLVAYAAAAVTSHLNIGHRHLLPLYAPLFILGGILARWLGRPARLGAAAVGGLLAVLALEAAWTFPDYLAYFNGVVPERSAYRHLVDSSLDWGQDLPAVRAYLDRHPPVGGAAYLSYFGAASPAYYGTGARLLYSVGSIDALRDPDWKTIVLPADDLAARVAALREASPAYDLLGLQRLDPSVVAVLVKKPAELRWGAGTYFVSASMLQPVNFNLSGPWGPWNERYEATYQQLRAAAAPLLSGDDGRRRQALMGRPSGQWPGILAQFEEYRLGRLTAFLRAREPDDELHYSILVYRLSAADVAQALEGPPPAFGPDDLAEQERELPPAGD